MLDLGRLRAVGPLRTMSARQRRLAIERGFARVERGILIPVTRGAAGAIVRDVNFTSAGGSSTMVLTVDGTGFQAGHSLCIGVFARNTANVSVSSCADTQSNPYTVGTTGHSTASQIATITAPLTNSLNISASDTITITFSGTGVGTTDVKVIEISGLVSSSIVDANPAAGASGSGASSPFLCSGPAVTTTTDDVVIGFFGTLSAVTVSAEAAGFALTGTQIASGGPTRLDAIWAEETSTGTYTPSVNYSAQSTSGRQATVALKVQTTTPVSNTCGMPVAVEGGIMRTAVEPIQTSQALAVTGPQPEETVHPVAKTATM